MKTYRQTYAWTANGTGSERYIRAQPVFRSNTMTGRTASLLGWKVWLSKVPLELDGIALRLDIGGGETDIEGDTTRPLVAASLPLLGLNDYTPPHVFGTDTIAEQFGNVRAVFSGWPGCYACLPIECDDTVRLLITLTDPEPPELWSFAVNATLWLRDDVTDKRLKEK